MGRRGRPFVLAGLVAALTGIPLRSQQPDIVTWVRIFDATGQSRGGTSAKTEKPPALTRGLGNRAVFFYENHQVRDESGRIVSGLSFQAWQEADGVRVAVYTLVPVPGAPNRYLAGSRGTLAQLRPTRLAEFSMRAGTSRALTELKRLGLDPWTLRVEQGPRR